MTEPASYAPIGQGNENYGISGGGPNPATNPLAPYFGAPMKPSQLINPQHRLPHEAINLSDGQDFADLYTGPSPFMAITLERAIVGPNEWPTRELMPWLHTDKINIGWQVWRFDRALADLEPEQVTIFF